MTTEGRTLRLGSGVDYETGLMEIVESKTSDSADFKKNVAIPYFKDIYKVKNGLNVGLAAKI
jgi:hypothetical protein